MATSLQKIIAVLYGMLVAVVLSVAVPDARCDYTVNAGLVKTYGFTSRDAIVLLPSKKPLRFKRGEILLRPRSSQELQNFLFQTKGRILRTNAAVMPPKHLGIQIDPQFLQPTLYTIAINPNLLAQIPVSLTQVKDDIVVSDLSIIKLLSFIHQKLLEGYQVGPNIILEPQSTLTHTEEAPVPGSGGTRFFNAFDWSPYQSMGSQTNMVAAWQYIAEHDIAERMLKPVKYAVIDFGFGWEPPSPDPDLPHPVTYDFDRNQEYLWGGRPDDWMCFPGRETVSLCWHGFWVANIGMAQLNNRYGVAGSGGQVAEPAFFRADGSFDQVSRALRTAVAWGYDVVSLSIDEVSPPLSYLLGSPGGRVTIALQNLYRTEFTDAVQNHGVVIFGAAGNSGVEVGPETYNDVVCMAEGVICVGGVRTGTLQRQVALSSAELSSNYGPYIDIWAPWTFPMYGRHEAYFPGVTSMSGTSLSTPFVAGIAAAMKAVNPALRPDDILRILQNTAHRGSDVSYVVDAPAALLAAGDPSSATPGRWEGTIPRMYFDGRSEVTVPFTPLTIREPYQENRFMVQVDQPQNINFNVIPRYGEQLLDLMVIDRVRSSVIYRESFLNPVTTRPFFVGRGEYEIVFTSTGRIGYEFSIHSVPAVAYPWIYPFFGRW